MMERAKEVQQPKNSPPAPVPGKTQCEQPAQQETEQQETPQAVLRGNETVEDFKIKNKIYDLMLYVGPELEQFPKVKRKLAENIDGCLQEMLRLVVTVGNRHYKKTTLDELDNEVDVLRTYVRLAADPAYTRSKKPCISMKKYKNISEKIKEIGCMIGGYYKYLRK